MRVLTGVGAPPRVSRVGEVLDLVDLLDRAGDRHKTYSLGMKQRLGIAAALLNDPRLLVVDEPANGLDSAGVVAMRASLAARRSEVAYAGRRRPSWAAIARVSIVPTARMS